MNYILDTLRRDAAQWETIRNQMVQELAVLPKGTLVHHKSKGHTYIYLQYSDGGKQKMKSIKDEEESIKRGLFRRAYINEVLPKIENNLRRINSLIDNFADVNPVEFLKKMDSDQYKDVKINYNIGYKLSDAYGGNLPLVIEWLEEGRSANDHYPEDLKHATMSGMLVRSKSELNIATLFEMYGIAYKYEDPVYIDGIPYYIDFVFIRPSDMKLIRWEHFGLNHNEEYAKASSHKVDLFRENGLTLWDNLITTYDTPDGALDGRIIQDIFNRIVLM